MGLRIKTNISSQMVQRNLKNTSMKETADLERLSQVNESQKPLMMLPV